VQCPLVPDPVWFELGIRRPLLRQIKVQNTIAVVTFIVSFASFCGLAAM